MTASTMAFDPESILEKAPFQSRDSESTAEILFQKIKFQSTHKKNDSSLSDKQPAVSKETQIDTLVLSYGEKQFVNYIRNIVDRKSTSLEEEEEIESLLKGPNALEYQSLLLYSYVNTSLNFIRSFFRHSGFTEGDYSIEKKDNSAQITIPFCKNEKESAVHFFIEGPSLLLELKLNKRDKFLSRAFLMTKTTFSKLLNASAKKKYIPNHLFFESNVIFK